MLFRVLIASLVLPGCASHSKLSETGKLNRQGIENVSRATFPYECVKTHDGYAGLVIVSLPEIYEIRSYFKGDAVQKLSVCLDDPKLNVLQKQYARAIKTPYSVADFEREKGIATATLRETDIDFISNILPYGHSDNWPEQVGVIFDGHVLLLVEKNEVARAEAVLAPLKLQTVYVREKVYEEVVLVSGA